MMAFSCYKLTQASEFLCAIQSYCYRLGELLHCHPSTMVMQQNKIQPCCSHAPVWFTASLFLSKVCIIMMIKAFVTQAPQMKLDDEKCLVYQRKWQAGWRRAATQLFQPGQWLVHSMVRIHFCHLTE